MRLVLLLAFSCLACSFSPAATRASEADIAARLRELGGMIDLVDGHVTQVQLRDCSQLGPAEFQQIGQLTSLKKLILYGQCRGLNDETLPLLSNLTQLEEMGSDGAQLSDAGLAHFKPLVGLRALHFFHVSFRLPGFTGSGFVHLKSLPKLERLTIAGTTFNDEGLAAVGQITQLREFRTWHTFQTQAGNVHLAKLPQLRSLVLGQRLRSYNGKPNPPSLDDATLATLSQIKTLESLSLDEAKLSAAGLQSLAALPKLQKLSLARIDISAEDLSAVQKVLPQVTIQSEPLDDTARAALEKMLKP